MLTDSEISALNSDKRFRRLVKNSVSTYVSDFWASAELEGPLNPTLIKGFFKNFRMQRLIQNELRKIAIDLCNNVLNSELQWPADPEHFERLIEARGLSQKWMKYDEAQAKYACLAAIHLLNDPSFRALIKEHTQVTEGTENAMLTAAVNKIEHLNILTKDEIVQRRTYLEYMQLKAEKHYSENRKLIAERWHHAMLGEAPPDIPEIEQGGQN